MHAQLQSTVPSRLSRNNYRTTALPAIPGGLWELFIGVANRQGVQHLVATSL
jgi:hypothetical protein